MRNRGNGFRGDANTVLPPRVNPTTGPASVYLSPRNLSATVHDMVAGRPRCDKDAFGRWVAREVVTCKECINANPAG